MKNNSNKSFLIVFSILVVIFILIIAIAAKNYKCPCETTVASSAKVKNIGKINKTTNLDGKQIAVPHIAFTIYFDKPFTVNNDNFSKITLYKYNITTSINHESDTSDWIGIKLTDLLKYYGTSYDGTVNVDDSNYVINRKFASIKNIYLLFSKNDKDIKLGEDTTYVVADIKEDSENWIYSPAIISNK